MKLLIYIFALLLSTSLVFGQSTESDYLEAIQIHIDEHKPIKDIYKLIDNYYRYCEKGNCKHLDQVNFLETKYSWHMINTPTLKRFIKIFKEKFPNSLYTGQINQLLALDKDRSKIIDLFNTGVKNNNLPSEACVEYSSIGIFQQYCDYLNTPFNVVITDTTFTADDHIYQFKYEGHDHKAPILKLLRGNGDGKINLLSNDSSKGSIQVRSGVFQEINFTLLSDDSKKVNVVFNSAFDDENQINFDPQINLDDGISVFNIKEASPPFTLQFKNSETYEEKEFVYADPNELSAESLSSLLNNGSYTLKIEDGNGDVSKEFHIDIIEKKTSFPWVPFISVLFFSALFYSFFKWFKQRKKVLPKKRVATATINPIEPTLEETINTIELNKKENITAIQADPVINQVIDENVKIGQNKPKINVSKVTNSVLINQLSKEELNAISDSGDYLNLSLKQLWSDSLVKNVYLRKSMVHRMDQDVRNEDNMKKEIGGFLLGRFFLKSSGKYDICLEEYIDIQGEGQSEFQIGFGADAWSKLEDSLEEFSHFDLIGWFHTHPGHGVFLSRPDKNISNNFFNKPYQVAMEIDPLLRAENPNLDTSFFTQKKNGDLNNNNDLIDKWHSWSEIVNRSHSL